MSKKIKHPVHGTEYSVRYVKRVRRVEEDGKKDMLDGLCDPPDAVNPKILIRDGLPEELELEITVHELLHFFRFDAKEETVQAMGEIITKVLWDRGWRKLS